MNLGSCSLLRSRFAHSAVICAVLLAPTFALLAQGPIAPTAPPGPTMKRLDEVQPRTIVNAANTPGDASSRFVISAPGSYYLIGNVVVTGASGVVNGIKILSDNVTLDLNGFTISSTNPSAVGSGVLLAGLPGNSIAPNANITILNGTIKGTTTAGGIGGTTYTPGGFDKGVGLSGFGVVNGRISGLSVQGVNSAGIAFSGGNVSSSSVNTVAGTGINASTVSDSTANTIGGTAIQAISASNVNGDTTGGGQAVVITGSQGVTAAGGDQRTPVTQLGGGPITIGNPGSYYLTGNVTVSSGNAIAITADNVTLDLNGFTVSSTSSPASGNAIDIGGGRTNLAISNGNIRSASSVSGTTFTAGPGFLGGINWDSGTPSNVRVSGVNVVGVKSYPLDVGSDGSSVVQACTVRVCLNYGISAGSVSDSSALQCGTFSIQAQTIANCVGSLTSGSGNGMSSGGANLTTLQTNVTNVQNGVTTANTGIATLQTSTNAANGSLTQLQQTVGARTAIPGGTSLVTLNAAGSYYLTGNITVSSGDGIDIAASNVTLDLNGFTISSTHSGGSGSGIFVSASRNSISIHNGRILGTTTNASPTSSVYTGGGFNDGIFSPATANNLRLEDVAVSNVAGNGINCAGASVLVRNCTVYLTKSAGISVANGVVSNCTADNCGGNGILCTTAESCSGSTNDNSATYSGIVANRLALNCVAVSNNTGYGGLVTRIANSCSGYTRLGNYGIYCTNAATCEGQTDSNSGLACGLYANDTASNSQGRALAAPAFSLHAYIAVGCTGSGGGIDVSNRYNMP